MWTHVTLCQAIRDDVLSSELITWSCLLAQIIKDYKLFMVVGVLVAIDIVTLTAWQILDPFYRQTSLGTPLVRIDCPCTPSSFSALLFFLLISTTVICDAECTLIALLSIIPLICDLLRRQSQARL